MKSLLSIAIAISACSAWASPNFETHKQKAITMLDERIAALQQAKTCTTNATAEEQLKTCHQSLKEDRMAMRQEHMKNKETKLMNKANKIKERREKMNKGTTTPETETTESTGG